MVISTNRFARLLSFLALLFCQNAAGQDAGGQSPNPRSIDVELRSEALSPNESAGQIVMRNSAESPYLLAHEPLVVDPVEVAFDDRGQMWVVEMRDYPFQKSEQPRGRIKVIADRDNDGTYDSATIFADNLDMPTGIAFWKDGVLVTVAGELLFLRDQDGDSQCDETQQWIRGFKTENEQLRANHPTLGPDGWWYIACGLRGGDVVAGSHYDDVKATTGNTPTRKPLKIGSRDIRFDPRSGTIQAVSGRAQFGLTFDILGSRLFCSNRNPAVQVIFEQSDLADNPLSGLVPTTVDVIPAGEESQVHPLLNAWTTSNLHAGQFTAACGLLTRVRPDFSGENSLQQELYVCEPTGSLIKRAIAQRGPFYLELVEEDVPPESEWLASRDAWFRPVNVNLGPSGEPVVVDMHRAVIEHPNWVPEELKNRPDERWGDDTGRVFLIASDKAAGWRNVILELQSRPLRDRTTEELAALVANENEWFRQTARRLLIERQARKAVPILVEQILDSKRPLPGRIESLRLATDLQGQWMDFDLLIDAETPKPLLIALLRKSREFSVTNSLYVPNLLKLAQSADPTLMFESLLCLAKRPPASLSPKLMRQVVQRESPHLLTAAAAAMRNHPDRFLSEWLSALHQHRDGEPKQFLIDAADALVRSCRKLPKTKPPRFVDQSIQLINETPNPPAAKLVALSILASTVRDSGSIEVTGEQKETLWNQIRLLAASPKFARLIRAKAIELMGYSDRAQDHDQIAQWAESRELNSLQRPVLSAFLRVAPERCQQHLLHSLDSGSPSEIRMALSLLRQSTDGLSEIAQWLKADPVRAKRLGPTELKSLSERADGDVRKEFQSALASLVNGDRAAVIEKYQSALTLRSDATRGKALFAQHCSACHQIDGKGYQVGPDISDSRTQTHAQLLTAILDPNRAIDNNFFRFVVLTEEDQIVEGIVVEETDDSIVLLGQEAKRTKVRREEIVEMRATGVSLMPEGLESQIDRQAMADLIDYIKNWRYAGVVPAGATP